MSPRKIFFVLGAISLCTAVAVGQASGNFTYGSNGGSTHCVLQQGGNITGGQICQQNCTVQADGSVSCSGNGNGSNLCVGGFGVGIKTSSGAGNVFDIRPSAVVGLLTDVSLQKSSTTDIGTSSALAGVDFSVAVSPAPAAVTPSYPVTYASRFVQISSNLFDVLSTTCTTVSTTNPSGSCFINFDESTVSAHSFDWIASGLTQGEYAVSVNWSSSLGNTGISNALTCVGPVNLTVTQNKIFHFNQVNSF
jgi:hypothetical protein